MCQIAIITCKFSWNSWVNPNKSGNEELEFGGKYIRKLNR